MFRNFLSIKTIMIPIWVTQADWSVESVTINKIMSYKSVNGIFPKLTKQKVMMYVCMFLDNYNCYFS